MLNLCRPRITIPLSLALPYFIVLACLTVFLRVTWGANANSQVNDGRTVPPNPARLYTKWNSWKDSVEWTEADKERAVRSMELIFAVPLREVGHMRELKQALNPNVKLLRYINIWRPNERLVTYTAPMFIHRNWPEQTGPRLKFRDLNKECDSDIVDVSRPELKNALKDAIVELIHDYGYDGVFFDLSAWESLWHEIFALDVTLPDDRECTPIRRRDSNAPFVTNDNYHNSANFLVAYHTSLKESAIGEKIHIFNGTPDDWPFAPPGFHNSDFYLGQYLDSARVDGGQMDTTFSHGQRKATEEKWLFQMETMRRFITHTPPKYFLTKVHSETDDELEYGFASYLLGTDGCYALFGAMGRVDWDTNPIMTAPLGNFVGDYEAVPGLSYVFERKFENGIVLVNAHSSQEQSVTLPPGLYRDVLRGTVHQNSISIPAQSGRILIKWSSASTLSGTELGPGDYLRPVPGWPNRPYELHIPDGYDSSRPTPVVLAIHGGGGNSQSMARLTCPNGALDNPGCLNKIADREGFIVVYPNGTPSPFFPNRRTFNAGNCCGTALERNVDDISYFRALLDDLRQAVNVDSSRVYATGMSNGAMMAHKLACELSDRITAIAPVGGGIGITTCKPVRPISALQIHGNEDEFYPFHGGVGPRSPTQTNFISIPATVSGWVSRNGCSPSPTVTWEPDRDPRDGTRVRKEVYSLCREEAEVVLYVVEGGGHTWPGGWQYFPEQIIGRTSRDINANEVIWEFFEKHPKL